MDGKRAGLRVSRHWMRDGVNDKDGTRFGVVMVQRYDGIGSIS